MKVCPRCGYENDDSVRFCTDCQHRFGAPVTSGPPKPASPVRSEPAQQPPPEKTPPAAAPERSSAVSPARSVPARQHTTFKRIPTFEGEAAPPSTNEPAGRKIVGILITYTWKSEGQLFPICE